MDLVGISGLAVSIAGFALSLWQIKKTRTAAEAAKAAADAAALALRTTYSIADIQEICGRSRDLLHLIRGDDPISTATAAFELRELAAKLHATKAGKEMTTQEIWGQILNELAEVHEILETAVVAGQLPELKLETTRNRIFNAHIKFTVFAAAAADSGVHHEHS
jgi:hypothetical protein